MPIEVKQRLMEHKNSIQNKVIITKAGGGMLRYNIKC